LQHKDPTELGQIFKELFDSATPVPRCVELSRRGLALIDQTREPRRWAALLLKLGQNLLKNPAGDRVKNLEEAIDSHQRALQILTAQALPKIWADGMVTLGNAYQQRPSDDRVENLERAIESYERALEVFQQHGMLIEWAGTIMNLGTAYKNRLRGEKAENQERAIQAYQEALKIFTPYNAPANWAGAMLSVATVYRTRVRGERQENFELAINACQHALEVFTRKRSPLDWARAINELGLCFEGRLHGNRSDNLERAIQSYRQALEVFTQRDTPSEWGAATINLATAFADRVHGNRAENEEQALQAYCEALQVFTERDSPMEWASAVLGMATTYAKRLNGERAANQEQAIAAYQKILQVRTRESAALDWALASANLANTYIERLRGDQAENQERAIDAYQHAIQVYTQEGMSIESARAMNSLGLAYKNRLRGNRATNLERAIEIFYQSQELYAQQKSSSESGMPMINLASTYLERARGDKAENIERAIEACERALATFVNNDTEKWGIAIAILGGAYAKRLRGDRDTNLAHSIDAYKEALRVLTPVKVPKEWATTKVNLAIAYSKRVLGDPAENLERAIELCRQALDVFSLEAWPVEHRSTQINLAYMYFKGRRWSEAASAYQTALSVHEDLYQLAVTEESRRALLRVMRPVPANLAYSQAKLGNIKEAVLAFELGRARTLAEALALDEAPMDLLLPEERSVFDEVRTRIRQLQLAARSQDYETSRRDFVKLTEQLQKAYGDLQALAVRIREHLPEFLSIPTLSDIQTAAADAPLVYLISTEAGGLMLVVTADGGIHSLELPGLIKETVEQKAIDLFAKYNQWLIAPGNQPVRKAWQDALDNTLHWLWVVGVDHILNTVSPNKELVLIAGGALGLFPVHAAWRENTSTPTGRDYALDFITFTYAPSACALLAAKKKSKLASSDGLLAIQEPQPVDGSRLPSSASEIRIAVSTFQRHRVLRHEAATRDAVMALMPEYPIVHFSCHARADIDQPLSSGFLMANSEVLTLRDLLHLRLPLARLALLSACETGIPDVELPDEVISLPAGLLQAGVAGVVASLWSVADISTMLLMTRFYELWRGKNHRPYEALRQAQKWVRDTTNEDKVRYLRTLMSDQIMEGADQQFFQPLERLNERSGNKCDFAHPHHWSAFQYVGI